MHILCVITHTPCCEPGGRLPTKATISADGGLVERRPPGSQHIPTYQLWCDKRRLAQPLFRTTASPPRGIHDFNNNYNSTRIIIAIEILILIITT